MQLFSFSHHSDNGSMAYTLYLLRHSGIYSHPWHQKGHSAIWQTYTLQQQHPIHTSSVNNKLRKHDKTFRKNLDSFYHG